MALKMYLWRGPLSDIQHYESVLIKLKVTIINTKFHFIVVTTCSYYYNKLRTSQCRGGGKTQREFVEVELDTVDDEEIQNTTLKQLHEVMKPIASLS